jgi:hypothetical protein
MVLGHQKGRDTKEKIYRNFGMPRPEGYRKALRLMKLAEKFGLPLFTFVDTPGAYPGIGAEERGQSEAIGRNLYEMAGLRIPIVVTVIGEGGSGGALAVAVGDVTLMLQYATYSVISPEGCASILWKSSEQAPEAAETLGITAPRLKQLGLIDKLVNEPLGGAQPRSRRDDADDQEGAHRSAARASDQPLDALLEAREDKILSFGKYKEIPAGDRVDVPAPARPRSRRRSLAVGPFRVIATCRTLPPTPSPRCSTPFAKRSPPRTCPATRRTGPRVLVALSGGRDSMVLLDALGTLAGELSIELRAAHVHHGLSAHADDWAKFLRRRCAARKVPLAVHHVASPAPAARAPRRPRARPVMRRSPRAMRT